jgi:hypothetical protein
VRAAVRQDLIAAALILAVIVAVVGLVHHAHGAERMLCHLEPLAGDWHYRTKIHPQPDVRCWYDGPRMKSRGELYWAEAPSIPPPMSIRMTPERDDDEIWNLLDRWRGEYQRGGAAPGWMHRE